MISAGSSARARSRSRSNSGKLDDYTTAVTYSLDLAETSITPAQVLGPIAGFGLLGAVGARLLRLLRAVPTTAPEPTAGAAGVHVHV